MRRILSAEDIPPKRSGGQCLRGWRERFEKFFTQLTNVPTAEGCTRQKLQSELVQIRPTNKGAIDASGLGRL